MVEILSNKERVISFYPQINNEIVRRHVAFSTIPSMPHAQILCLGIAFRDTRSYLFAFSNTSADYVCKPSRAGRRE